MYIPWLYLTILQLMENGSFQFSRHKKGYIAYLHWYFNRIYIYKLASSLIVCVSVCLSVLAFLSLLSFDVSSTGLASMQLQPYANSASSSKAKTPEFLHMSSVTTSTTFSRVPALPRLVFVFSRTVWDLVPRPGIKPAPPTLKAQS